MNTTTLELNLPEAVYEQLEKQPPQIRKTAIQLAIETIADYLKQEAKLAAGRELLLRLPEEAQQHDDTPPRMTLPPVMTTIFMERAKCHVPLSW
jgi:hypothetical protein